MSSPLFTVEQVLLLKRLYDSGITKTGALNAYEELERVDGKVSRKSNDTQNGKKPKDDVNNAQTMNGNDDNYSTLYPPVMLPPNFEDGDDETGPQLNPVQLGLCAVNAEHSPPQSPFARQLQYNAAKRGRPVGRPPKKKWSVKINLNSSGSTSSQEHFYNPNSAPTKPKENAPKRGRPYYDPNRVPTKPKEKAPKRGRPCMAYNFDDPPELLEFKKKGPDEMLLVIKNYITTLNIRQTMVAEMTGLSQGYISRFFRGDHQEMSEKAKNAVYSWYLTCLNDPSKMHEFYAKKKMVNENGTVTPVRKDRFLFRKEHLSVLEEHFEKNQYTDSTTKEALANQCNKVAEESLGRPLQEHDRVTPFVVSNWFNNRRKDLKCQWEKRNFESYSSTSPVMIETYPDFSNLLNSEDDDPESSISQSSGDSVPAYEAKPMLI